MTYNEFIQSIINTRGQWNIPDNIYFEGHHIVPKCLGGTGNSRKKDTNIIWLLPEEHYEAHKLLALENPDNDSIVSAWSMIAFPKNVEYTIGRSNKYVSEEDYCLLKQLFALSRGKKVICIETQEIYNSISEACAKTGAKNIVNCCIGKRKKDKGYHWAYLEDTAMQEKYKSFIGKPQTEHTKKIICVETQEIFISICEANKKYAGSIKECLLGKVTTAGGYHWAYLNDLEEQKKLSMFINKERTDPYAGLKHKIRCIETDRIFESAKEAARYLNKTKNLKLSSAHIMYCCRGIRKTAGGYHWEFISKEALNDYWERYKLNNIIYN